MLHVPVRVPQKEPARASAQSDPLALSPTHPTTLYQEMVQEVYKEAPDASCQNLAILYKRNPTAVPEEMLPATLHPQDSSRPPMHRHPLPQASQALALREGAGGPPPIALPDHAPRFFLFGGFFDEDLAPAIVVVVENLLAGRGGLLGSLATWRLGLLRGKGDGLELLGFREGAFVWPVV